MSNTQFDPKTGRPITGPGVDPKFNSATASQIAAWEQATHAAMLAGKEPPPIEQFLSQHSDLGDISMNPKPGAASVANSSKTALQKALSGPSLPMSSVTMPGVTPPQQSGQDLSGNDFASANTIPDASPVGNGDLLMARRAVDGLFPNDSGSNPSLTSADPSGGMLNNLFGSFKPQDWLGLGGLGLNAVGTFMNASTQKDQFAQQMALEQQQLANQLAIAEGGQKTQRDIAAQQGTQLNPFVQQEDLAKNALRNVLAQHGPAQAVLGSPNTYNPGAADFAATSQQYLNPHALANAGGAFQKAQLAVNPDASPMSLGESGLGADGAAMDADVANYRTQLQNDLQSSPMKQAALKSALMANTNTAPAEHDDGGGFWKTLGKIGAIAAPIIAAPFTGGASLALIGAGAGAAGSALNGGGLGSILMGAGLGAIPGIGTAKGAATPATSLMSGLKTAGTSLVKNPLLATKTAANVASALRS